MKNRIAGVLIAASLVFAALGGCGPFPAVTPAVPTEGPPTVAPTNTPVLPTPTPEGNTITVTSPDDAGPGTLRQALEDAQPYDKVVFDTAVFPPDAAATIFVQSALPQLTQGHLTIDASDAGVVLDGSRLPEDSWITGVDILSDGNTIRGLQIINFTGVGIVVTEHARNNTIGGDRNTGAGPIGQGNLSSGNDFGIGIWNNSAGNVVTGNLVGTDPSSTGNLGNSASGVSITEGALDNTVGPDNIIAYNGRDGIEVEYSESVRNMLTGNSIHDNSGRGIFLMRGGNTTLAPPHILDFDVSGGLVSGIACPNCTVEVFSDAEDEGAVYEGSTRADEHGTWAFNRGSALANTSLTATATDADGNTSEFSRPVFSGGAPAMLQEGNSQPASVLQARPSSELQDNHIGVWVEDYGGYHDTDLVFSNGFKRIRIGALFGGDVDGLPIFDLESIPTEVDTTISAYVDNGVQLALILATGSGVRIHYTDYDTTFRTEEEIGRYIEYVKFVMAESRGRIKYYEILNEPGYISVETYANLIRAVVPVIREGDPNARITIGAIPGSWENGYPGYGEYQRFELYLDYLNQLIRSGVAASVDGISWHPLYDNIPADPYYQNYPQMVRGIQDLAASQGFTGEYFADEILWQTVDEPDWDNGPPVNERMAAKYYLRAITEHRGLGLNVTINTFFIEPGQEGIRGDGLAAIRDLNNTLAGAEPVEFPVSVDSEAPNVRQYAFSLPNGDRLVALWTNDGAVEDDPGVSSTISIPGFSASAVAGIDVLNGFEQDLVSSNEDQDLVINGLLLKDYPIFIRLAP